MLNAVRLMYLGAVAEFAVLVSVLVTAGSISSAARSARAVMGIGIASVVLLVVKQSWPYYAKAV